MQRVQCGCRLWVQAMGAGYRCTGGAVRVQAVGATGAQCA